MRSFQLQIVTPERMKFNGKAESLTVRADDGDVQIMAGHVDYMASIGTGKAIIRAEGGDELLASCSDGFITVTDGEVKLVAVTFEFREDIDLERAIRAKERAERKLAAVTDRKTEMLVKAKLKRALNRISIAEYKK